MACIFSSRILGKRTVATICRLPPSSDPVICFVLEAAVIVNIRWMYQPTYIRVPPTLPCSRHRFPFRFHPSSHSMQVHTFCYENGALKSSKNTGTIGRCLRLAPNSYDLCFNVAICSSSFALCLLRYLVSCDSPASPVSTCWDNQVRKHVLRRCS